MGIFYLCGLVGIIIFAMAAKELGKGVIKACQYDEAAEKYNAQLKKEEEIYAALTANENE
ncbi:MAG: hypothetical protein IKU15_05530 [Clostridia bacterium]|nr:hypothetical protein [Treponema sp.]MBR4890730.1 hypothetical protein [Clostridia bacterium]